HITCAHVSSSIAQWEVPKITSGSAVSNYIEFVFTAYIIKEVLISWYQKVFFRLGKKASVHSSAVNDNLIVFHWKCISCHTLAIMNLAVFEQRLLPSMFVICNKTLQLQNLSLVIRQFHSQL